MSCSSTVLEEGVEKLRQSLIVYIFGIVVTVIGILVVVPVTISHALRTGVLKLNAFAGLLAVVGIITTLYVYLVYRGFASICLCIVDFFCFAKKLYLAMVFISLAITICLASYASGIEIELRGFEAVEKMKEITNTLTLPSIATSLLWIFVGGVFYRGIEILGSLVEITRLKDGALIGYISLFFSFLGNFVGILSLIALVLTFVAIAMIYSGLGTLIDEKLDEVLKYVGESMPT